MILAQDGYGDASKIEQALQEKIIAGFILCPKNRSEARVTELIEKASEIEPGIVQLFDPEYQAAFVKGATNLGKLPDYDYFEFPLGYTLRPKQYEEINKKTLDYQKEIGVDRLITPSPIVEDYEGISSYSSKMFAWDAQESQAEDIPNMLVSVLLSEAILSNTDAIDGLLNELTGYTVNGFYIVIDHSTSNSGSWNNPGHLAALMLIVNVLSSNGFEVYVGYTDAAGLLLLAAGARAVGTGWWKNSRSFDKNVRYFDGTARRPKKAYFSKSLLNFISLDSLYPSLEVEPLGSALLNGSKYDASIGSVGDNATWTENYAVLNYWQSLNEIATEMADLTDTSDKLDVIQSKLLEARGAYDAIKTAGLSLGENETGGFITTWLGAIELFRKEAL